MNDTDYRLSLDIFKTVSQATLPVKQGDTAYRLCINITANGSPYVITEGCYALFTAKKPDGNFINNKCTIKNNTIYYHLTPQTTAAIGIVECEIVLYDANDEQLATPHFNIFVDVKAYNGEDIKSSSENEVLKSIAENAIKAEQAATSASEAKSAAEAARDAAQVYEHSAQDAHNAAKEAQQKAEEAYQSTLEEVGIVAWYANEVTKSEENTKKYSEEAKQSAEALSGANNIFGNALKGTASGEVIGINDVSPIEHEMGVKVSGKNLPDISAVKVKKYGKNLVDISQMLNNVLVDNGDGTFSYTRASDNYFSTNFPLKLKAGTTITLNMEQVSTTDDTDRLTCSFTYADGSTTSCYIGIGTGMEFTAKKNTVNVRIFSYNTGTEFVFKNLQFEIGSTATEYEPYIQPTEYTPDADGTVQGVTSLYPSTTLMTDTDGAIIEAIYNKDINKAFEELKNAILATGGNV